LTGSGEGAVAAGKTVAVNARELRDALDFVSAGEAFDHSSRAQWCAVAQASMPMRHGCSD
jgi:hypothetical protein